MDIEKIPLLARESVYGVLIYPLVENAIKSCSTCLEFQIKQLKDTLIPDERPGKPWETSGTDIYFC